MSRQDVEDVICCCREKFEETKVDERKMSRMKRRSGIVDGGYVISNQVIQATQSSASLFVFLSYIVSNAEKTIFFARSECAAGILEGLAHFGVLEGSI